MNALREQFEPEINKELYRAELQTHTKKRNEDWAVSGDDLELLADRAYMDLPTKPVDEAVHFTLKMESYIQPTRPNKIAVTLSSRYSSG